jgi:SAM-dependent methyltransferase
MHCPDDWYQTFFTGVALDMWRNAMTPEMTRAEADTIQGHLRVGPPARLLDVPCGNGRLAIELASRGYHVFGIDIAGESIDEGKANADAAGVGVDLRQGDMRDLAELGTFDGVYCWGNSFGYLEEDGNLAFLFAAGSALAPGGRLVLEFGALAETALPNMKHYNAWYEAGDVILAVKNGYDLHRGRLVTEYTFIQGGAVEKRMGSQQVFTLRELKGLLTTAGFDHVEAFGYDGQPLQLGGQRAVIVARKGDGV